MGAAAGGPELLKAASLSASMATSGKGPQARAADLPSRTVLLKSLLEVS